MIRYLNFSFISLFIAITLTLGCSGTASKGRVDYKSKVKGENYKSVDDLKLPPGLSTVEAGRRYTVPGKKIAKFSEYEQQVSGVSVADGEDPVSPEIPKVKMNRDGVFRWLVVELPAEDVWDAVRQFWVEEGFVLAFEDRLTGILETDWAENRALLKGGAISDALERVFPLLVTSPERDKYRTRVERLGPNLTEIYISHEGLALIASSKGSGDPRLSKPTWQYRSKDPNLEAEMLVRLRLAIGGAGSDVDDPKTPDVVGEPLNQDKISSLSSDEVGSYLMLEQSFDRAWRRVGLTLDSLGFAIDDKDREKGIYFFRYNDPDSRLELKGWKRFAFWKDRSPVVMKFGVRLVGKESVTLLRVIDEEGEVYSGDTADKILNVLHENM